MAKRGPSLREFRPFLASLVVAVLGVGCAVPWTAKDGTRHHLVVGLGWVRTGTQPGIAAQDIRSLGLVASRDVGVVGLTTIHRIELDPQMASNAVVSIRRGSHGLTLTNFAVTPTRSPQETP
jgi:hypothetical protein